MSFKMPNGSFLLGREDRQSNDELWQEGRTDLLPCVCLECQREYKHIPAGRVVKRGEKSHGYCPECIPIVEERYFGGKV